MPPRKRSDKYAHYNLPENVEINTKRLVDGSVAVYARYVFPAVEGQKTRQRSPNIGKLPNDLEEIKAAAIALNLKFYSKNDIFDEILKKRKRRKFYSAQNPPVETVTQQFCDEWLKQQEYSDGYRVEAVRKISLFAKHYEGFEIRSIRTFEVSNYLSTLKQEPARQAKTLLKRLFMFAKSKSYYLDVNPVGDVLPIKHSIRVRKRHTHKGVWEIYDAAPDWLQRAMGVAIYSLQRRGDLVQLHKQNNKINTNNRSIEILQSKVDVYMEITMGEELHRYVNRCMSSSIDCPYLIHKKYQRQLAKEKLTRTHPFAVKPEYITRAFRSVRDKCGVYNHLPVNQRPSFHDLRAYGIFAYHKAGYPIEYIQALAGHASAKMTQHYIQGHEKRKPLQVEAGLSINSIDWESVDWEEDLVNELPNSLQGLLKEES